MIIVTAKREMRPGVRTVCPTPSDYHFKYVLTIGRRSPVRLQSVLHYNTSLSAIQAGERASKRIQEEGNGDE